MSLSPIRSFVCRFISRVNVCQWFFMQYTDICHAIPYHNYTAVHCVCDFTWLITLNFRPQSTRHFHHWQNSQWKNNSDSNNKCDRNMNILLLFTTLLLILLNGFFFHCIMNKKYNLLHWYNDVCDTVGASVVVLVLDVSVLALLLLLLLLNFDCYWFLLFWLKCFIFNVIEIYWTRLS